MDLDTGTVQTYRFKSHAEKTLVLQAFKNPVQNTGLVPSAHAHVDRMPLSEPFREPPPFAPIFHDIQNGIEHLKVVVGDIASMDGETICYTLILPLTNLHHTTILTYFDPFDNILSEHTLDLWLPLPWISLSISTCVWHNHDEKCIWGNRLQGNLFHAQLTSPTKPVSPSR